MSAFFDKTAKLELSYYNVQKVYGPRPCKPIIGYELIATVNKSYRVRSIFVTDHESRGACECSPLVHMILWAKTYRPRPQLISFLRMEEELTRVQ